MVWYIGHLQILGFIFQCHIFLPFHTVPAVLKASMLKWLFIPFSMDHAFSELSNMTRSPSQHGS